MQRLLTADKNAVQAQKAKLYNLISLARNVTARNTYVTIREAEKQLYRAKGIYETLFALDLIDGISISHEDLERMEAKIADIIAEKQRSNMIRRH